METSKTMRHGSILNQVFEPQEPRNQTFLSDHKPKDLDAETLHPKPKNLDKSYAISQRI